MTRYFITGAQGFVGRHLVAHLLGTEADSEILGTGRSAENRVCFTHQVSWGSRRLSAPLPRTMQIPRQERRYRYLPLDLADVDETSRELRRFRPDVVIHLASALRGDSSLQQFRTNAEGSLQLVAGLEHADVAPARLVFGSTGGVYGLPDVCDLPLREVTPCRPADIYGVSKLAAEQATRLEVQRLKWPAVWARLFNIVGIGQDERHVCGRLASQAAAILRGEIAPRLEVGALEATRDFIDVHDVARALVFLAHHERPLEVVNVASGRETSIGEVLRVTLSRCGLSGQVEIVPTATRGEVTRHVADVRLLNGLGFSATIGLEQSLDELVKYYLNHVASMEATEIQSLRAVPLKYFRLVGPNAELPPSRAPFLSGLREQVFAELVAHPTVSPPSLRRRDLSWYSQAVVPVLVALESATPERLIVNRTAADGLVREQAVWISRDRLEPFAVPSPPAAAQCWIERFETHERLFCEAVRQPSLPRIREVLANDPLVPSDKVTELAMELWERVSPLWSAPARRSFQILGAAF